MQFAIIHARGAYSALDFFLEQGLDEVENHIHQGVDVDYVHLAQTHRVCFLYNAKRFNQPRALIYECVRHLPVRSRGIS